MSSKAMNRKANRQHAERRRLEAERQHAQATITDPVQLGLVTAYYTRQLRGFIPIRDLPGHYLYQLGLVTAYYTRQLRGFIPIRDLPGHYLYQLGLTRRTWEPTEPAQDHPPIIRTRRTA